MAPSLFSHTPRPGGARGADAGARGATRRDADPPDADSRDERRAERPADEPRPSPVASALADWRADLSRVTGADQQTDSGASLRLALTGAHPGGLAQLYAERTTKLSNLVREQSAHRSAVRQAHRLIRHARQLTARHGLGQIHLAMGEATWVEDGQRVGSPALLRPVALEAEGPDEVLLTLLPGTEVAPDLVDAIRERNPRADVRAVAQLTRSVHGFSPARALAELGRLGRVLDHFDLREVLTVGIFLHPAQALLDELGRPDHLADSVLVRALAGDEAARARVRAALPEPNSADRDPWDERGVGDQSPRQQDLVEAVAGGASVAVDAPQGADDTGAVASILAEFGSRGRRVLYVTGESVRLQRVQERMRALGVGEIAARVDGSSRSAQEVREQLVHVLADTSDVVDEDAVAGMRKALVRARDALSSYTTCLHRPFAAWGVSPFDVLQVLTDLTGMRPGPRTHVRLPERVLTALARDRGARAKNLLARADYLGMFSAQSDHPAWEGAVVTSGDQVPDALARIARLAGDTLPAVRVFMTSIAGETGLRPVTTVADWEGQLGLLEGVRGVLDVFRPEIFERSAADMILATAPRPWRRQHGIAMPHRQRVRLVRQARGLVRPGRYVEDLHRELLAVQREREAWRASCEQDGWPQIPEHLDEAARVTARVHDDLEHLAPYLATAHGDLFHMPVTQLGDLLDRLTADPSGARELPQRVALLRELREAGLEELAADLRRRHVGGELVGAELELAWWASALGVMLQREPRLGGFDPARLERLVEEERELDQRQVESLGPQAVQRLRRLRTAALAKHPEDQTSLMAAMQSGVGEFDLFAAHPLVSRLIPVVLTSPTLVPYLVPEGRQVELLVLDAVDELPIAELVPVLARARQVVVLADLGKASQDTSPGRLANVLVRTRLHVAPERLNAQIAHLLLRYGVEVAGVPVPWTSASSEVSAVWTNGTGMPAPGSAAIESSSAEVDAVVEMVVDHALTHPEQSLAVVALNARHADRIRDAVRRKAQGSPGLRDFFDPARTEPFTVVDPSGARGVRRDRVIIAVGFAKTPHGRVLHDFGVFSTPRGRDAMANVLRTVRSDVTLVSSMRPGEIDRSRLTHEGANMLVDLLEVAEGGERAQSGRWSTLESEPDHLLIDLAERLHKLGLQVVPNVGVPGGMRIPLAIGHPEVPGELLVAVLTDDDAYVAEPSLRVRDRQWPKMLEEQGWRVRTELSMAVFIDPQREADAIVQDVLDAVDARRTRAADEEPDVPVPPVVSDEDEGTDPLDTMLGRGAQAQGVPAAQQPPHEGADDDAAGSPAAADPRPPAASPRGPRPPIARGLPLAAYTDDQLDELAQWIRSDGVERDDAQVVDELRATLAIRRRGAQTDAVLRNVAHRTRP